MVYTMSEKARKARAKNAKKGKGVLHYITEEHRQKLVENCKKRALPPRLRVMVDKALYEETTAEYDTLDNGLRVLLQKELK